MIDQRQRPPLSFTVSRKAFDAWCETMVRDAQNNRVSVDKAASWPRFKAQVESGLRQRLRGTDFNLDEGDTEFASADPSATQAFFSMLDTVKTQWRTWRVAPQQPTDEERG